MIHNKNIRFIAAILSFTYLFVFSSCISIEYNNFDETINETTTEGSIEAAQTEPENITEITDTPAITEPPNPEQIEIEILQAPVLPVDSITANVTDIAPGIVFDPNFRRGVNMGNMLEAPSEGEWGVSFDEKYFPAIKQKGFDFVRLPVGWGNHVMIKGDTITIQKKFMDRVKYIVDEALKNDLGIIINIHHFTAMDDDPEKNASRLYEIWRIISESYQNYPPNVVFEIFNEPHNGLEDTKIWNRYQNECVKIIRASNPTRKIIISGGNWGGISGVMDLIIPEDENLILSFHYYDPFNFTHQGADWTGGEMDKHLGTTWTGSDFEKKSIDHSFRFVKAWSEAVGIPVFLGEFGAYSKADMESRVLWTEYMRETAEYYGFAWSYWEFCAGFGIYDQAAGTFFDGLADALTGTPINEETYATGEGAPMMSAPREGGYFGPFKTERNINLICDSWTGMSLYDTETGTQIIELGGDSTVDWAQAYIILNGLTDTGEKFSHDILELTIRNIDGSITDFCLNLDNNGSTETQLAWMDEKTMKGSGKFQRVHEIIQNDDGTTTFILDLQSGYRALKGKCDGGIRLKMFIESVPDRSKNYDRIGSVEFIKAELK